MKRLPFICVLACFLFHSIIAFAQNSATVPAIESITVTAGEDTAEKVIIKLNGSHTPTTFKLDGERSRLVFDFYGVTYRFNKASVEGAGGDIVAGVRAGRHNNPLKTRVVVDIKQNSPYHYEQTFNVSSSSLVITFFPGDQEARKVSAAQHIKVGKAKVIHEAAPVSEQKDVSQEKTEAEQKAVEQDSASQAEDTKRIEAVSQEETEAEQKAVEQDSASQAEDTKGIEAVSQEETEAEQKAVEQDSASQAEDTKGIEAVSQEETEAEQKAVEQDSASQAEDTKGIEAVSQEKTEAEQKAVEQDSATQVEEAKRIEVLSADEKKQKAPEEDTSEDRQDLQDISVQKGDESIAAVEKEETVEPTPVLLDVSFEQSINNSETVLFKLSHFYPPLVFGIEKGEPRVVCDFHDAEIGGDVPSEIEAGGKYVNRVTVASLKDPDKIRVELQLVPNHHYDLQQLFFKEDNLFVIIVNELKGNGEAAD